MRDAEKTIGGIIGKSNTAYLGSVDSEGFPNMKAMLVVQEREGLRTHWFSTNTSSRHVAQLRENPKACVYFVDRRFYRGALLRGTVEVCEDQQTKQRFWRRGDEQYYPLGVTDPDYCILRFTAKDGRYYSHFKSEDFAVGEA